MQAETYTEITITVFFCGFAVCLVLGVICYLIG